jgi:hypothetical protein
MLMQLIHLFTTSRGYQVAESNGIMSSSSANILASPKFNYARSLTPQQDESQTSHLNDNDYAATNVTNPKIEQYNYQSAAKVTKDTGKMSDHTQDLVDAKLATVEARAETRFVELSAKIDRVADAVDRLNDSSKKSAEDIKSDNGFTRVTIIGAVIATVIAGLAALWVTQSNMLASFQLGISLSESQRPK